MSEIAGRGGSRRGGLLNGETCLDGMAVFVPLVTDDSLPLFVPLVTDDSLPLFVFLPSSFNSNIGTLFGFSSGLTGPVM